MKNNEKEIKSALSEKWQKIILEENDQLQIVDKAISHYGNFLQRLVAIEEMAELTKELIKTFRGEHNRENIVEEIADVEIMIQQLCLIYDCAEDVVNMRRKKIERLKKRLENADKR